MKTVTVRQLRQRWPEVQAALEREGELFVTRDGTEVARLIRVRPEIEPRARYSSKAQMEWLKRRYGRRVLHVVDDALENERADA